MEKLEIRRFKLLAKRIIATADEIELLAKTNKVDYIASAKSALKQILEEEAYIKELLSKRAGISKEDERATLYKWFRSADILFPVAVDLLESCKAADKVLYSIAVDARNSVTRILKMVIRFQSYAKSNQDLERCKRYETRLADVIRKLNVAIFNLRK